MSDPTPNPTPAPDSAKELETLKTQNAELMKKLEALQGTPKPDDSLADKARLEREAGDKRAIESKNLEAALKFNIGSQDFLKSNASLLPKTIEGIFQAAEKENYGSAIEKSSAIKVGIVSEFFAQESNLDLLTSSQKLALEDFQKLTKNVKQERVQQLYDQIFEPTLETLKKIRKAEALQKGQAEPNDKMDAYKKKISELSFKHYVGVRKNA